ncbi:hypothetical protein BGX24_011744 [Mortierella sp. AD032]|nr:hypothetical protein BGX24_011744 [Mortierella sp. AD032]
MTSQDTHTNVQAVRCVYENGQPATNTNTAEVFHLPCHLDPSLNKDILLLDDIASAFIGVIVHICSGTLILPCLKGPDFNKTTGGEGIVSGNSSKALPGLYQQRHYSNPAPTFNASAVTAVRQNPAGGLVEAAWENYTHIDNPDAGPARRGQDNQGASNNNNNHMSNSNIDIGAKETKASSNSISLARPPQELTSTTAQDITEIMMNARLGDMHAQNALGEMYDNGREVHQDYQAAMDWYLKAAEQDLARAQFNIGDMYDYGRGLRKASAQDYAPAHRSVGQLYQHGLGVLQDFDESMNWYIKAANQGDAAAQASIGLLYQDGHGVPQDYTKAMYWYRKAAD